MSPKKEVEKLNETEPPLGEKKKKWQFPNLQQWLFLFRSLSQKEKIALVTALFLGWVVAAGWGMNLYFRSTTSAPAQGGIYIEGLQGQPLYINPIISQTNLVDSDICKLIFSSLFRYDKEGKLEQDLVESWERSEDGLTYTVSIRKDAKWHDGEHLTAEDVLFTLNLIRNPQYASTLRGNWEGIQVEKTDDYTLQFTLKKPYVPFLHNLTFGILPKHLWENITSDKFTLTELNRKPVGSGPFSFLKLEKDKTGQITSITLRANKDYYRTLPKLSQIALNFYSSYEEMADAFQAGSIEGIAYLDPDQAVQIEGEGARIYALPTTRIFAIFFNQTKSIEAADKKIRKALSYATNREELVNEALGGKGRIVHTPLLPNMLGFNPDTGIKNYDLEEASKRLDEVGWKILKDKDREALKDEDKEKAKKIRYNKKKKKFLELTLTVPNYPELLKVADILKRQWEQAGVTLQLEILDTSETIQSRIQDRDYEILLFGEMLQADPDPTPFWHSSSKKSPGLNLALFDNDEVDNLLDAARQEVNEEKRAGQYRKFQEIIDKEAPVIFLFSPHYLYAISDKYQEVDISVVYSPSNRFNDIEDRHLRITRVRK